MMSFYDTLKSVVDKVILPRRTRKGARRIGDPCRVRKEVWLEPPIIFKKKSKISGRGGYLCSKSKLRDSPKLFVFDLNPIAFFFPLRHIRKTTLYQSNQFDLKLSFSTPPPLPLFSLPPFYIFIFLNNSILSISDYGNYRALLTFT